MRNIPQGKERGRIFWEHIKDIAKDNSNDIINREDCRQPDDQPIHR